MILQFLNPKSEFLNKLQFFKSQCLKQRFGSLGLGNSNLFRISCLVFSILALLFVTQSSHARSKKHPATSKPKIVRTTHPKDMFDHDGHTENYFTPNNIPCESCHINDQYEWKKMNHGGCHNCHKGDKWRKKIDYGSKDCSRCHENWTVTPADHRANWERVHKTKAKAQPKTCKNCHNDRFCEKCHEQRQDIILQQHDRNYKYFHSIDARSNPKKCDRCHQVVFCNSCHASRRSR